MNAHSKRGIFLHFDPSSPPSLEYHTPDIASWTGVENQVWCYGELLSYRGDGDTLTCLNRALQDWRAGRLDHARLNGRFVLIFRDSDRGEWQIITDRVGAMHAYMGWEGDRICEVGSDLLSLHSARVLDWKAIASFCAFGFFIEDWTYFTDTRILLPHSIYCIGDQGELRERRSYWDWHHRVEVKRSYDDTVAEYDRLLRQASARCAAHGRIILPISGGLDSRSLAAVLPDNTSSYSYGYTPDSVETRIAAQVAQTRGFPFTAHTLRPYLFERLDEIVGALHGSQDVTQARQCSVNGWVRERAEAVLTGLWGDVWCDQMGLADGLPEGITITAQVLKKFQKRGRAWLLENLVQPHLPGLVIERELTKSLQTFLEAFEGIADPDFKVKAYKTSQWAFRWSNSSLRGFALGATPRIPYYDVDLIDFFCTVPTAFVRDRRLQIDHLKRYAPHLARVEWQSAGANLYWAQFGKWISFPRRVINKVKRTIQQEKSIQRNWEVQFLSPEGRQKLTLTLMTLCPDFVQQDALQKLIDQFYQNPNAANGYTVSMLVTLAGWMAASQLI